MRERKLNHTLFLNIFMKKKNIRKETFFKEML